MSNVFIVIGPNNQDLLRLEPADYLNEADLQALIADQPALLEGCTSGPGGPRPLLLIRREMPVPNPGGDNWSLDHFYVDLDCTPVLVEVKRSANRDVRRPVVGQMLDYAANAPLYWSIPYLQQAFQQEWGGEERAQRKLEEFLAQTELSEDEFWLRVQRNIEERNLRLVFVADAIPQELRNIIEFLNARMTRVDVLGLALRQYKTADGTQRVIVPEVIGRTGEAEMAKTRVAGAARSYEMLDAVVQEYRRLSGNNPPIDERTGAYRQIRLAPEVLKGFHYEFQQWARRGITCEFHAEVTARPALDDAMRSMAEELRTVGGLPLEYIQRGSNGGLRLIPSDQSNPAAIARTMVDLITATRERLLKVIQQVG